MTIGPAVDLLKAGARVTRGAWARGPEGVVKYLELQHMQVTVRAQRQLPFVAIFDGRHIVPWTCSQSDLLADDWTEA